MRLKCRARHAFGLLPVFVLAMTAGAPAAITVNVSSTAALQSALQDASVLTINLATGLRLTKPAWRPVAVDRNVTVAGASPSIVLDLDLRDGPLLSTSGAGRLVLRRLVLVNFTSSSRTSGAVVDQLTGAITFDRCVFLATDQRAFGLLDEFQLSDPMTPYELGDKRAFTATLSDGPLTFVDSTVVIDSYCQAYAGGVVAFSSASLLSALRSGAPRIYMATSIMLNISDFTVGSTSISYPVTIYSCPSAVLDLNDIRDTIIVAPGGSVTLQGMTISHSFPAHFVSSIPPGNTLFLGAVELVNGSLAVVNSTVLTDNSVQMQPLAQLLGSYPPAVKPEFKVEPNGTITVPSWRLTERDWLASQGQASTSTSAWEFQGVRAVAQKATGCFGDFPGIKVSNDLDLQKALLDNVISHIQIMDNITFDPARWPPEATGPNANGINISRTIDIRACHPSGGRYVIDFSNIGQIIFVYGHVRFLGDLQIINSKPSARRLFLYLLISALSVETNGIIEFQNVTINGTTPSPLNDASDPIWSYQKQAANIVPAAGTYTNVSFHQILLHDYVFSKALWVQLSQGKAIPGKGYWRFSSVTLQWWPAQAAVSSSHASKSDGPRLEIILPCVLGGVLLLAGLVAAAILLVMRRKGQQAKSFFRKEAVPPAAPLPAPPKVIVQSSSDGVSGGGAGALPVEAAIANMGLEQIRQSGSPRDLAQERIEEARRGLKAMARQDQDHHLVLQDLLGQGSFGRVYRGYWRGTLVAVKTMVLPPGLSRLEKHERMAIMEAAISSSLSHPNVVQTYTYIIKPLQQPDLPPHAASKASGECAAATDSGTPRPPTTSAPADSGKVSLGSELGWEVRLVQELCDKGSLRDALNAGLLRGTDGGVDMGKVVETALDVAHAMVHLHEQHILHSDLKARNILLKTSATDARGFSAKVADFGLSLQIPAAETHISDFYQGTMTHMAPEVLVSGKLSRASDVYAYAVLLWELYTGGHAFEGIPRAYLGHEVAKNNRRPELPDSCPFEYRLLVYRCWESDASIRPTFQQILEELKRMKAGLQGGHTPCNANTIPTTSQLSATKEYQSSLSSSASAPGSSSLPAPTLLYPSPPPAQPAPTDRHLHYQPPTTLPPLPQHSFGPASWDTTTTASAAPAPLLPTHATALSRPPPLNAPSAAAGQAGQAAVPLPPTPSQTAPPAAPTPAVPPSFRPDSSATSSATQAGWDDRTHTIDLTGEF